MNIQTVGDLMDALQTFDRSVQVYFGNSERALTIDQNGYDNGKVIIRFDMNIYPLRNESSNS